MNSKLVKWKLIYIFPRGKNMLNLIVCNVYATSRVGGCLSIGFSDGRKRLKQILIDRINKAMCLL